MTKSRTTAGFRLAPLHPHYVHGLDAAQLTRAVTALSSAFVELDLANWSWAYWLACAATPHIAPAHFGAAIEALQAAYIKGDPATVAEGWAPSAAWKPLRTRLGAAIDGSDIPDDAKAALKLKLATFNAVDQRTRFKAVMTSLGLQLGANEDAVWRRRNKAAHGAPIPGGEEQTGIRDVKLLRGRVHRMLLRITNAADQYIDFTSPGFDYRLLETAPPDQSHISS